MWNLHNSSFLLIQHSVIPLLPDFLEPWSPLFSLTTTGLPLLVSTFIIPFLFVYFPFSIHHLFLRLYVSYVSFAKGFE